MSTHGTNAADGGSATHTLCGDRDAEARVTQDLARLSAAIDGELGRTLGALFLLGPYARGEGSVVERNGELQAQSCYELLAVVGSSERKASARFERIAATWSDRLGVDVHLCARTEGELQHPTPALTWMDVAGGHVEVLTGDQAVLGRIASVHPKELPPEAWGATLCDAAAAIATANLDDIGHEQRTPQALHEGVLACGDALLLSTACYAFRATERCAELETAEGVQGMPGLMSGFMRGLAAAYTDALRYMARPDRWVPAVPLAQFRQERLALLGRVHLGLEARRVGAPTDPMSYALHPERLWSDTSYLALRALRASLRAARQGNTRLARPGDARERLARCAVLLAYARDRLEARHLAARLLGLRHDDTSTPSDVELYVRLRELREEVRRDRLDDPLAGARYGRS